MAEELKFPDGFLWGSATASYQVEGGIENNDWAQAAREGKVPAAGRACDQYNRYRDDFDIAKSLGQNAHRFSIEWARIEPEEGSFDEAAIEHYRGVLGALRERGLEPFVTLWHFTLPVWFARIGGFENKKAPFYFARYCEYVVKGLGDSARFWMTINEPMIYASQGYFRGIWPPFSRNILKFKRVVDNLITSHNIAYKKIKGMKSDLQIGIAKNNIDFDSTRFNLVGQLVKFFGYFIWKHYFFKKIRSRQDFIGLNYYFHKHFGYKIYEEKSDMGSTIYSPAIHHVLTELKKYRKPVYITENGIADATDAKRAEFIKEHLRWVHRAIHDGVDVRGYFYWSLLDNFEWDKGFKPRFGLVEMNYETMGRNIRPSAYEYARICKTNSIILDSNF
ncbi:MAG: glycoside hydrolase family 1 protein [Candidatus Yanofskybacteria bacterium]|nr:glycoside hydrolase family 1 protein [Candidatus Yanofskybacteria bacterium]